MPDYSAAFKQAQQLLRQEPLPADTEQQLAALEEQIRPEEEPVFGDLWEAYFAAADSISPAPKFPTL